MKKILTFILIILSTITFVGCDFFSNTTTTNPTTSEHTTSTQQASTSVVETTVPSSTTTSQQVSTTQTTVTTQPVTTTPTTSVTTTEDNPIVKLDFYSINDFHGGTYSDISYLSYIGGYLKEKQIEENTIILSNGDIFQGAALSNYFYGEPIVEVFNHIGFDGFVIGNHEFDWGIDKVMKYQDQNLENKEMDYPLLAANIVYKDTQLPIENTSPYIVKEIQGVKVGIIGLIGQIESSISASRLTNIEFKDPEDTIYEYTDILRTDESCELVVVYIHDGSSINYDIADFTGTHYIDAIFNGHTHQNEYYYIPRSTGQPLAYAQASNYDTSLFAHISLTYNKESSQVTDVLSETLDYNDVSSYYNQDIQDIIDLYVSDAVYNAFVSEELAYINDYYERYDLGVWAASVIRDYVGIDVGALNWGGFRNAMPEGMLTMGDMIEIYPFDNYIKTCELTGYELKTLLEDLGSYAAIDDSTYIQSNTLYVNGVVADLEATYTVGAVDYLFDKTEFGFLEGRNVTITQYLMRDILVEDLKNTSGNFNPYNGTSFLFYPNMNMTEELKRWIFI